MKKNLAYLLMIGCTFLFTACPEESAVIPIACFEASANDATVGELISFTNCSQDAEYYSWDFGDNGNSTDVSPVHSYGEPGLYTVTLTAHNKSNTNMYSETIKVIDSNLAPEDYNGIPAESYVSYFNEDFNSSQTEFSMDPNENRTVELVDGVYRITVHADGDWIFWTPVNNPGNNKDYEIEFSIRYIDYRDLIGSGILWASNANADEFYFYFIYPDGDYLAGYYKNGWNKWFDFISGGNITSSWNKMTLRKVGNTHYGFLNERLVFEEDFDGNFGDYFGLYVANGATVEYDYFNTYLIGNKKSAAIANPNCNIPNNKPSGIKQIKK